ncbi:hypothetical protein [Actinobacillus pleuropneumoniae]|uniref:hypothetical protein n=1 Tax=Actinobacillus pleuropneumoniae TaxID=715 RepID=UPI0020790ACE|nr:hypothetical protein [Actinobacillus pleuropneumoniae]
MNSSFLKTAKFAQFGTMKKKNDFSALWILWGIEGRCDLKRKITEEEGGIELYEKIVQFAVLQLGYNLYPS